jgi:MFS family permease
MEQRYGWVIVGAGALMTCVAVGAMFSLAVFLGPMSNETGWTRAAISSAMTLNFIFMGLGAFFWGWASDRFGTRIVVLIGAVMLGLALVVASRTNSLGTFQLTYGILVGFATSAFFAPMIALTTGWFEEHRALAVSLVSAGVGVAPLTMSPFAQWMILNHGWRSAMLVVGLIAWALLIPAAWLVRKAPATPQSGGAASMAQPGLLARALRSPQFIVLSLTFAACCAAHSGPIFHMVSYATICGLAPMAAVSVYSVEGFAGLVGRVLFGMLADRFGAKLILIGGLMLQAIAIATYTQVSRLQEFYALAVLFGAAYGGVMPLYAVLARDYFPQNVMGTVFGAAAMVSSLGMAFGPLIGGWVYDTYNSYAWMFMGSALVGLGAVAIALAFPPPHAKVGLQPA